MEKAGGRRTFILLIALFYLSLSMEESATPLYVSGVYPTDSLTVSEGLAVKLNRWDTITVVYR
jgi:hypothetical protein